MVESTTSHFGLSFVTELEEVIPFHVQLNHELIILLGAKKSTSTLLNTEKDCISEVRRPFDKTSIVKRQTYIKILIKSIYLK